MTPCRLDGLAIGALLAIALGVPRAWRLASRIAAPAAVLSLAGILLIGFVQGHFTDFVDFRDGAFPVKVDSKLTLVWGISLLAVFFGSALVLAIDAPGTSWWKRALERGPLSSVGKYSFGMYVLHQPILMGVGALVDGRLGVIPAKLLLTGVTLPLIYAAAWLSYHLYERRFLALKRFVEY